MVVVPEHPGFVEDVDADSSLELPLRTWRLTPSRGFVFGSAVTLLVTGLALERADVLTVGAAGWLAMTVADWIFTAIDIRHGWSEPAPTRWLLIRGVLVFCLGVAWVAGALAGGLMCLSEQSELPTIVWTHVGTCAVGGATLCIGLVLVLALVSAARRTGRRWLESQRDRGDAPADPRHWVALPTSRLFWTLGAFGLLGITTTLLALGFLIAHTVSWSVGLGFLAVAAAAFWMRRRAAGEHGLPTPFRR